MEVNQVVGEGALLHGHLSVRPDHHPDGEGGDPGRGGRGSALLLPTQVVGAEERQCVDQRCLAEFASTGWPKCKNLSGKLKLHNIRPFNDDQ